MDRDNLQRRASSTIKQMGVNSYSQIISAFRAQGDLTNEKLSFLPVLQNVFGISRERHTAEVKRALNDEQLSDIVTSLNPSSGTTAWERQADYICPKLVHRPPITDNVHLAEKVLKTTAPVATIQYASCDGTAKLNPDLKQAMKDIATCDGVLNASAPQPLVNYTRQKSNQFNSNEMNGFGATRLTRPKPVGMKPKSSLDTLSAVVQKDLLRVPERSTTEEKSLTKQQTRISTTTSHSILSSQPATSTAQQNYLFKVTPKCTPNNTPHLKRLSSYQQQQQQQQQKSIHYDYATRRFEENKNENSVRAHFHATTIKPEPETIEDIVYDTLKTIISMITGETNTYQPTNTHHADTTLSNVTNHVDNFPNGKFSTSDSIAFSSVKNDHNRTDQGGTSQTFVDSRTSPMKATSQVYHPSLVTQPNASSTTSTSSPTISGSGNPTLFVAPRIINFQPVVPKQMRNIHIGNTKIILVSPSNITQHLPHTTAATSTSNQATLTSNSQNHQQQSTGLLNKSPVKLVKFNTNNSSNPLQTRTATLPINNNAQSTLTLAKNVQIVIPSQNPSTLQLTRSQGEDLSKSMTTSSASSFRPVNTMPLTFTTCSVDHIPQASQEVTISTSPTPSPSSVSHVGAEFPQTPTASLNTSGATTIVSTTERLSPSTFVSQQHGSISHGTSTRTSPLHDETIKSVSLNITAPQSGSLPRPTSTHGPMIYRMTSVNPNVPVFRLRAATTPTQTTVINKSLKTEPKPIAVTTATNVCYEPKQNHSTPTASGAVSVLACFKTTKKRPKERAIMPRPSTSELNDSSHESQQQRLNNGTSVSNLNIPQLTSTDLQNGNGSYDYQQSFSTAIPTRLLPQISVSSTYSDDPLSNPLSSSMQETNHDTTISSTESIPVALNQLASLEEHSTSIQQSESSSKHIRSSSSSPLPSISIDDSQTEQIIEEELAMTELESKKRKEQPDNDEWIEPAIRLINDLLLRTEFRSFDALNQQDLASKFHFIETSLITGFISTIDEFHQAVLETKHEFTNETSSNDINRALEDFFDYFQSEFLKLSQSIDETKRRKQDLSIN